MSQTLLEMAKDLVVEQLRLRYVHPEGAQALLMSTHATLQRLHQAEESGTPESGDAPSVVV